MGKKEKKKMRRESSESSSDDKSVSSSSESNAEKQKNKVQETLLDEEKDEKKILVTDGELILEIIEASNLVNKDAIGKSDPFVRVSFNKEEFKSKKVRNNLEPKWNFPVTLRIDPAKAENNIEIKVYDDDFGAENFIGSYCLSVKKAIQNSGVGGVWYDLSNCKNGKICISAQFNPTDSNINKQDIVGMNQEEELDETSVPDEKQNMSCKDTDLSTETSKAKEEGIAKDEEVDGKKDSNEQLVDSMVGDKKSEKTKHEKLETEENEQIKENKEGSQSKPKEGVESKPTQNVNMKEVKEEVEQIPDNKSSIEAENQKDSTSSKVDDDVKDKGEVPYVEESSTAYIQEKNQSKDTFKKDVISKDKDIDVSNENENSDLMNTEILKENEMKEKKDINDVKQNTTNDEILEKKVETKITERQEKEKKEEKEKRDKEKEEQEKF